MDLLVFTVERRSNPHGSSLEGDLGVVSSNWQHLEPQSPGALIFRPKRKWDRQSAATIPAKFGLILPGRERIDENRLVRLVFFWS
jgi:hypothetical protein